MGKLNNEICFICFCQVNGETILCEGSSSSVIAEVYADDNTLEIYSVGNSSTSASYFPRVCPECGRAVNFNISRRY